ncbi:MAG: hypothetical protein JW812_02295, partial [Alphaproteobacteria bacterium]|nr:hypothetical protein [Alphaproteobacteria bacterium]
NEITQLWRFIENKCGVRDKAQAKSVAKNIKEETHKTVCELIKDLEKTTNITQEQAIDCVKQLDLKY